MIGRVWKCHICKNTYDLAVVVPELAGGRELSDDEYDKLIVGGFHNDCPGPPGPEAQGPRQAKMKYDWRTGR